MLRRFSEELVEDREFEIGGELFEFCYPNWEVGAWLFDDQLEPAENGNGEFSFKADTELAIERIPIFLDPKNESHERFTRLVERKPPNAVPRHQLVQCYRWLVEVTSGLPTTPPSESDSLGGSSDTPSEEESSSQEETPAPSPSETSSQPPTRSRKSRTA